MIEDPNEITSLQMIRRIDKTGKHYFYSKSKDVVVDFSKAVTFLYPVELKDGTTGYRMVIRKGNKNEGT